MTFDIETRNKNKYTYIFPFLHVIITLLITFIVVIFLSFIIRIFFNTIKELESFIQIIIFLFYMLFGLVNTINEKSIGVFKIFDRLIFLNNEIGNDLVKRQKWNKNYQIYVESNNNILNTKI
jgi:cellulose synthase/poly-beta-1,6-N-acetylglucosamine synthase-like glycosyltransferase